SPLELPTSHTRRVRSSPTPATDLPSGEKATAWTVPRPPLRTATSFAALSETSIKRTQPLRDPEPAASIRPFDAKAKELNVSPRVSRIERSRATAPTSQRRAFASLLAEARRDRSLANAIDRIESPCPRRVATALAVFVGQAGLLASFFA